MNPSLKLAHYVVNTNKIAEIRDWYCTVLNAEVVFKTDMMCFITYDAEHVQAEVLYVAQLTISTIALIRHWALCLFCLYQH